MAKSTETTAVATKEEGKLLIEDLSLFQQGDTGVTGLETIDASDIKMPKIKLLQPTSPEVQKSKGKILAGQFYNTVTQAVTDEVEVVFLAIEKTRVMFPTPFKRGEEALCKSYDAVHGQGCGSGVCAKCDYSNWDKAKADGKNKPDCNMGYVWIGVDAHTNEPFRMIMSGAAVAETKDFLSKLRASGISPYRLIVTLGTEEKDTDSGVFYIPVYKGMRGNTGILNEAKDAVDPAKVAEIQRNIEAFRGLFKTEIVEKDLASVGESEDISDNENDNLY
ncbi:MAG: hypothetical protein RR420_01060 [Anaerovoracaceae bacterium]